MKSLGVISSVNDDNRNVIEITLRLMVNLGLFNFSAQQQYGI